MPIMCRATNDAPCRSGIALTLILTVGALCRSSAAAGLLDLTQKEPGNSRLLGIPGATSSRPEPAVKISIQVTILNLWPPVLSSKDRINLDILVRNTGKESILIPASKDYSNVIKAGNSDQRMMGVQLEITHPGDAKPLTVGIGAAVGSSSVPDSMIRLAPQETLVIRVAEKLSETWKWHEAGLTTNIVEAKVVMNETFLENDRFFVKNWSDNVRSSNSMKFTWGQ